MEAKTRGLLGRMYGRLMTPVDLVRAMLPSNHIPEEENRHDPTPDNHPVGKGIFVQTVQKATREGTPEALAEFADNLELDWVALLCIWQHDKRDRIYTKTMEAAAALNRRGIEVWVWGWPHPDRPDTYVRHMSRSLNDCEAVGVIHNIEAPYYGKRNGRPKFEHEAAELMFKMRAEIGDHPMGLSSYGALFWHRSAFPWTPLAKYCDFGMPQIYDVHEKHGPEYPERCFDAWRGLFSVVCPTLAASKRETPQEMRDKLSRTPLAPAVSWWDMNHVRYSKARQAVIREMDWWDGE